MLEVPLGFVNARNEKERADVEGRAGRGRDRVARREHDRGRASASNMPAIRALRARYAADTGARVVITDRARRRARRHGAAAPGPAQLRDAARVRAPLCRATSPPGPAARARSATTCSTSPSRSPPEATSTARCGSRYPTSELDRARPQLLARRSRAIAAVVLAVGDADRPQLRALDQAAARGAGGGGRRAGAGDLAARAPVPDGPPELRRLALEFNDMVARVDGLVSVAAGVRRGCLARAADAADRAAPAAREPRAPRRRRRPREPRRRRSAEVDRLSRLVDELLALARADAARPRPRASTSRRSPRARIDAWRPAAGGARRLELDATDRPGHALGARPRRARCSTTSSRTRSAQRPAGRRSRSRRKPGGRARRAARRRPTGPG